MFKTKDQNKSLSVIALILAIGLMAHFQINILWMTFTATLIAIALYNGALGIKNYTRLSYGWSITLMLVSIGLTLLSFLSLFAFQISQQFGELLMRLKEFINQVQQIIQSSEQLSAIFQQSSSNLSLSQFQGVADGITFIGTFIITLVAAAFIAISPVAYQKGIKKACLWWDDSTYENWAATTYTGLKRWLFGKLIAMFSIAVMAFIGLTIIGVEYALVLALIAGLLSFIPNLGPILTLIPVIAVASFTGLETVLYVVVLFMGIQVIEGNVLLPVIEQGYVNVPPALILGFQVLLGTLFGIWGIIVAAPFTVLVIKTWPFLFKNKA